MRERIIEAALVRRVRELGGVAYKWTSPGRTGVPDRIVMLPGSRIVFVELKSQTGKCTARQLHEHKTIHDLGFDVVVVNSLEMANGFNV